MTATAPTIEDTFAATKFARLEELDEPAWLSMRKKGIGGSDAASVAGVGEFKSAFEVYCDKTDWRPAEFTEEENEAMEWGKLLEDAVAAKTARHHGVTLVKPEFMYQHTDPDLAFMLANLDRVVVDPQRDGFGVYEGKTCSAWMEDRWGDEPNEPATYALLQAVHYGAVMGFSWAIISVLIAGQKFRTYRIDIDPQLVSMLTEYEADFWDRVLRHDPPPPSSLDSDTALLNRLWDPTKLEARTIIVGDEGVELAHRYNVAHKAMKAAEDEKKAAGNELRLLMGDATEAVTESGLSVCTWNPQSSKQLDNDKWNRLIPSWFTEMFTKRSTIRVLRPSKKL